MSEKCDWPHKAHKAGNGRAGYNIAYNWPILKAENSPYTAGLLQGLNFESPLEEEN